MSALGLDRTPEEQAAIGKVESQANSIFIASIISILFCCLGGAVATYFAHQAKQDIAADNIDAAKRNVNIAMVIMIIAYAIGLSSLVTQLANFR